jgi:hypothetical protein
MKLMLCVLLALSFATAGSAVAQDPIHPIDLRADRIEYLLIPEEYAIDISVYFTVHSAHADWAQYWQYLSIYLDENEICCYPPYYFETQGNGCETDIECGEPCQMTLMDGNADEKTALWMNCDTWHTWGGTGCDPFDPANTCQPLDVCACGAQYVVTVRHYYDGESGIRLVLDNTYDYGGAGMTEEADETNNTCTVVIGSVGASTMSWGAIKSLF